MTGTPAAAVFFSLIAILLTWILWFTLYRGYRASLLCHRLGPLQDELFDFSLQDPLGSTHPDYLQTKHWLETALRRSGELTTSRFAMLCWIGSRAISASQPPPPGQLALIQLKLFAVLASHLTFRFPLIPIGPAARVRVLDAMFRSLLN